MDLPIGTESKQYIPIKMFDVCALDGLTRKDILKLYSAEQVGKRNCFYLDKFSFHLKKVHGVTMKDYCIATFGITWPKCPIRNEDVGYEFTGVGMFLSLFIQGAMSKEHCPNFKLACERNSREIRGGKASLFWKAGMEQGFNSRNAPRIKKDIREQHGKEGHRRKQKETKYC